MTTAQNSCAKRSTPPDIDAIISAHIDTLDIDSWAPLTVTEAETIRRVLTGSASRSTP